MYDNILVEEGVPLPEFPKDAQRTFQTKSLDNLLTLHRITKSGRLMEKIACSIGFKWHDTEYHGIIRFYTNHDVKWYEYAARFTDGQLVCMDKLVLQDCAY